MGQKGRPKKYSTDAERYAARQEQNKKWYNEIGRERAKQWYKKNRKRALIQVREWQNKNRLRYMWLLAKNRAKRMGVEFSIEEEDIIIPEVCPYLGWEIHLHKFEEGWNPQTATIDRIDPTHGYVKGNIMVISRLANIMKNTATPDQVVRFAEHVLEMRDRLVRFDPEKKLEKR